MPDIAQLFAWDDLCAIAVLGTLRAAIEDVLGTCSKDRRLLADLRYLQLLSAEPSHLQTEICNLIEMRLKRPISPHVDLELQYHPITLALFHVSCSALTAIVRIYFLTITTRLWQ